VNDAATILQNLMTGATSNDQTGSNETSFDLIECISDNDTVFSKRVGLYTGRVRRTCIGHHI